MMLTSTALRTDAASDSASRKIQYVHEKLFFCKPRDIIIPNEKGCTIRDIQEFII